MKIYIIILTAVGFALSVSSCRKGCTDPTADNYDASAKKSDESCTYPEVLPTTADVKLAITHMVGTESFAMNTDFTDDHGNKYQFTRAHMYLSSPTYMDDNMNMISAPSEYAIVSPSVASYDFGTVPADAHIHMMNISVGVDSVANASDPGTYATGHPLSYQSPATHWNWNSGYIFIILEGVVDIDGNGTFDTGETFALHVGTNNMLAVNNGLMAHFNAVGGQTHNIALDLDWGGLLTGIDLSIDNSTHTMDNMPLATTISTNAETVLSIHM